MRHCREDYEAIQPWPTKRPHHVKDGVVGVILNYDVEAEDAAARQAGYDGDPRNIQPLIPDDEPVFLIRAQDVVGPAVVNEWARLAEINGADPALCERVRQFAHEMKAYADEHGKKTPDTPPALLKEVQV